MAISRQSFWTIQCPHSS